MSTIEKEDYLEPRCLLSMAPMGERAPLTKIPLRRVLEKLDEYTDRHAWGAAKRHIEYWLAEARAAGDRRGEFSLLNERMGFYRKQGRRQKAYESAGAALALVHAVGEDSIGAGTCYVNCGTVYDNFDEPDKALAMFEKARPIYEKELDKKDPRLGALYNNMGLAYAALGRYGEAGALFRAALAVMADSPPDRAITWLNMADAAAAASGEVEAEEEISGFLKQAAACLDAEGQPRNGYYAFVCSKCAPGFDHYGWFAYAAELKGRSEKLYAGLGDRERIL